MLKTGSNYGVEKNHTFWKTVRGVVVGLIGGLMTVGGHAYGQVIAESEPNDSKAAANAVDALTTELGTATSVQVTGASTPNKPKGSVFTIHPEDNGSIGLATDSPMSNLTRLVWTECTLGDGPHGSAGTGNGDYDFFGFFNVTAGEALIADVDTPGPLGSAGLDSALAIYDSSGNLLTVNDDDGRSSDSRAFVVVPSTGDYFVAIGGAGLDMLSDPFDSSTGLGVGTAGTYEIYFRRVVVSAQAAEDNGSISLATDVNLTVGEPEVYTGVIGDGPHGSGGSSNGDFDFFEISGLTAGDTLIADVNASVEGSPLDSFLAVWDSNGVVIAMNNNDSDSIDSVLSVVVPEDGTYYVSVGGAGSNTPSDPFDSSSGPGAGSEGAYTLLLEVPQTDADYYRLTLRGGDVIGGTVDAPKSDIQVISATNRLLVSSNGDGSSVYPAASPLPGGAGPTMSCVIPQTGTYFLKLDGHNPDGYTCDVSVHRPPLESAGASARQILFLDFDGATVDTTPMGGPGVRSLSPLSNFLAAWGLNAGDEDAVIDAVLNVFEENISTDLESGNNPFFDVEIRNSRDHADPFGSAHVSRIVIGGTQAESGLVGVGAAESMDPGNFETEETGIVLLDTLSAPAGNNRSLNSFGSAVGKVALIGEGVGNIAAHVAGHLVGNLDTHPRSSANLMSRPELVAIAVGLGPDGKFGTRDDVDQDFGVAVYWPSHGMYGLQDTLNTAAFGMTSQPSGLFVNFDAPFDGTGSVTSPFKFMSTAVTAADTGDTIRIFPGSTPETFRGGARLNTRMTLRNHEPRLGNVVIGQ